MSDNLSNMISQINNGHHAQLTNICIFRTKFTLSVLDALERGGYIKSYKYLEFNKIQVSLRYSDSSKVFNKITRISKPGRRIYVSSKDIPSLNQGIGSYIISTPQGVLLDIEAKSLNIGGELLCKLH